MQATGENRNVVYINWDGFAYAWYELVNRSYGGTPHLNALLDEGVLFTRAETGIPSITGAMQQCIASGAWPADTGNCYRYYDVSSNRVIQFGRHNVLENIAEAAVRHGVSVASVNAWYFENRGTYEGNMDQPYIRCPLYSNFADRVDAMIKVIDGEPVDTGDRRMTFAEVPRLLSVYADDIDTVSHNGRAVYSGMQTADTLQMWYDNIAGTIMRMDAALGRLVEALKRRGVYDRTAIVLTTDHGMAPYGAPDKKFGEPYAPGAMSCLPDFAETVAEAGRTARGKRYKVEVLCQDGQQAQDDTEVVITVVTLQAQINFRIDEDQAAAAIDEIVSRVRQKPYYGAHLGKEQLLRKGAMPGFADLLVSPKPPYHMAWDKADQPRAVGANHDSLDPNVRRIFTMIAGAGVKRGFVSDEPASIIDIAPTIARLLGFEGPRDAVGTALNGALSESLRGPELRVDAIAEGPEAGTRAQDGTLGMAEVPEAGNSSQDGMPGGSQYAANLHADGVAEVPEAGNSSQDDMLGGSQYAANLHADGVAEVPETGSSSQDDMLGESQYVAGLHVAGMASGRVAVIAGVTAPHAAIRVNRRECGAADAAGCFAVSYPLAEGHNRLVIEAEADGRVTRLIAYVPVVHAERKEESAYETVPHQAR